MENGPCINQGRSAMGKGKRLHYSVQSRQISFLLHPEPRIFITLFDLVMMFV